MSRNASPLTSITRRRATLLAALTASILTAGCQAPWSGTTTEEARLESARASVKLRLYRPLKVSLRSLPDPALVSEASSRISTAAAASSAASSATTSAATVTLGTREHWQSVARLVAEKDPRFATLPDRSGLFAVSTSLRTVVHFGLMAALVPARYGLVILFSHGGSIILESVISLIGVRWIMALDSEWARLILGDRAISLETTPVVHGNPFGGGARESASNLYAECHSLSAEDEDRYPSVASGLVGAVRKSEAKIPPDHPFFRLEDPSFEHLVLGCTWVIAGQAPLALHELDRVKRESLGDVERSIHHLARIRLLSELDCPRAALADLEGLEKSMAALPPGWLETGKALRAGSDPVRVKDLLEGTCAVLRARLLRQTGQQAEAKAHLERISKEFHDRPGLGPLIHVLAAQEHLRSLEVEAASGELKQAVGQIPFEDIRTHLVQVLAKLQERQTSPTAPTTTTFTGAPGGMEEVLSSDLTTILDELTLESLFRAVLSPELMDGARRLAEEIRRWIDGLWASLPSRDQLETGMREWWDKSASADFDD